MPAARVAPLLACALLVTSPGARAQQAGGEDFGATARVAAPPDEAEVASGQALRTLRRRMGDSFNAAETLPGVVPVFSGVPYLLVRGAPPAASALYYDGVPVPWLFHLALGPAISHAALIGELRLYHGVPPARYGRLTGAVFSAEGPEPDAMPAEGEVGVRLLDAEALVITGGPSRIAAYGRVGYPELMLNLIESDAVLAYWDYQLRIEQQLSERDRLIVASFGAYDRVGDRREPDDDIELQFHRVLLRLEHTAPALELQGAVYAGYEQGLLGDQLSARSFQIGPSLFALFQLAPRTRLRIGADMEAKVADLERHLEDDFPDFVPGVDAPEPGFSPQQGGQLDLGTGPAEFVDLSPLADVPARNAGAAYMELGLVPAAPVAIEAGVRGDVWVAADKLEHTADVRLLVSYALLAGRLTLHAGGGTVHQAAVSPLPIPGLSDYALDYGPSGALQTEAGAVLALPAQLTLSATGFYHRFQDLVFMELIIDCEGNSDPLARFVAPSARARATPLCQQRGLPRGDGHAYGVELLLKRDLLQRLTGWASYTLGFAEALAADGTVFEPQFDVRHVLNLVAQADLGAGFEAGLLMHYRSGKPAVNTLFDFGQQRFEHVYTRLPGFFRADVNLGYRFATAFGRMAVTLQWLNLTFSREATKRDCVLDTRAISGGTLTTTGLPVTCRVDYQPAIVLPNAGVRAEF